MTSAHAQLLQLERDLLEAIRTRNEPALRQLLAADFELRMPGEAPVNLEGFVASVHAIPGTMLEVGSDDTEGRVLGEVGMLTGHQRARVRLGDGSVVTQVSAFTDVARWVGGRWVLVHAYTVNISETVQPP